MCDVKGCDKNDLALTYYVDDVPREVCDFHFNKHCSNVDSFSLKNVFIWRVMADE